MKHPNFKKSSLVISLTTAFSLYTLCASSANAQSAHVHGAANMNLVVEGTQLFVEFEAPMASVVGFEYAPQTRVEKMKVKNALKALESAQLFEFGDAKCNLTSAEAKTLWLMTDKKEHDAHDEEHEHHEHDEDHKHDHDEDHDHDHDDDHEHDHDEDHEHDHDEDHEHDHDEDHDHDHDEDHEHDHDEDHERDHDEDHDHDYGHEEDHEHDHNKEHKHADEHHDHDDGHDHDQHDQDTHSDISLTYQFECQGDVTSVSLAHFNQFELMESIKVQWISSAGQGSQTLSKGNNQFSVK